MTKSKTATKPEPEPAPKEAADSPVVQPAPDSSVLSEKTDITDGAGPATSNESEEDRNNRLRGTAFAAIPPVVQLDASDDVEIERRSELRLKGPRQEVQAARERAQSPGFVPAESEESIAFNKLKAEVAREVRAEVLKEKTDAGKPLLAKTPPESEPTPASNANTK